MQKSRSDEAMESFGLGTNVGVGFPFGVGAYMEVWGCCPA